MQKQSSTVFNCDKCGLCCQNLHKSSIYRDMHNGDGVCFHYDDTLKLCTIYENRPLICNVTEAYQLFEPTLGLQQYFDLNYQSCQQLKKGN